MGFWGGVRIKKSSANHEVHLYQELGIEDPDPPVYKVGIEACPVPEWESTREIVADVYVAMKPFPDGEFEEKLNGPCDLCPLPNGAVCEPREPGKTLWEL